ncbi:hypothetical protein E3N88_26590 [Mikania micrantha]|uniref:MSP domain-containing protein n=1 Tax=Mikania micrantha TaxID=192012 RepID=A0A5N6MU82_9ASTR|nr:hypothetical protein E3N88_26590 [Mikania micrantha]
MEKLIEVSDQVVPIDFVLGTKCRATVRLRSLSATASIAFKVQTSSPHKFLVNPPTGLIPPLTQTTFQIILKPQPQIPSSFPRSTDDRFLIRTARVGSGHPGTITSWTYDVKLKVVFVGPFLLRHAVNTGDCDAVRSMIKVQRMLLADLSTREAESLYRVANRLDNSGDMVSLLLRARLKVESATRSVPQTGGSSPTSFYGQPRLSCCIHKLSVPITREPIT